MTCQAGGIREAVDRYAQPVTANAVTVTISALGPHAEVLGAIALAIQTEAQPPPP